LRLIRKLPTELVNKIAAGEVIERPASVVKELLENALDAGARRIEVHVADGGKRSIKVVDDGCGIPFEDLTLALAPHATSKIRSEDDLYRISTMGFRGEALASIAAVAQVRLVSRVREADSGGVVTCEGGRMSEPRPCGCPVGTTVEVRNLFFNTPARRKFLRTAATEMGHISEQIARIALAHPGVAFKVLHNDRVLYDLPARDSCRQRIADLFGAELAESLITVERDEGVLKLFGLVCVPGEARSSPRWQYTWLNGRYIRDRFVQHAVREAYRGLMDPHLQPIYFIYLSCEPEWVDVNVHPTKIEVRWSDSGLVHGLVLSALRETFLSRDLTPSIGEGDGRPRAEGVRRAVAEFFQNLQATQKRMDFAGRVGAGPDRSTGLSNRAPAGSVRGRGLSERAASNGAGVSTAGAFPLPRVDGRGPEDEADARCRPRAIQLHNTYLVAETPDGMIIVDQHALHERILYEQLSARLRAGRLESQRLLLPEIVRVRPEQTQLVVEHAELLRRLGIEATPFGTDSVAVQAFPTMLQERVAPGQFMLELLDRLAEAPPHGDPEPFLEEVLQMMACKAAVKAGEVLSQDEIEHLLASWESLERGSACPHGRPTVLRFSIQEIERRFKRA